MVQGAGWRNIIKGGDNGGGYQGWANAEKAVIKLRPEILKLKAGFTER